MSGGNSTLSPDLVHFFAYSLEYSRTIFLPSSGSLSNERPYLHAANRVTGVKYSLSQLGANVFLMRLDVFVSTVWFDCEDEFLSIFFPYSYCGILVYKLSSSDGIQI